MMLNWMVRIAITTLLIAGAAGCIERALRHRRRPARWVWTAAIIAVPMIAVLSSMASVTPPDMVPGAVFDAVLESARIEALRTAPVLGWSVDRLLGWFWVASSALALVLYGAGWARVRQLRASCRPGVLSGTRVLISAGAGPAAVGMVRPVIVVPEWLFGTSERSRRLVLLHEAEHLRAGDPLLLALIPLAAVAMPWNLPLWWMLRALKLSIELDCDQRVLARGVPAESYGRVLIDVAGQRSPSLALALATPRSKLAHRLVGLTVQGSGVRTLIWAMPAVLFLALAVEAAPASSSSPALEHRPLELAELDPRAEYQLDGVPVTYEQVRVLEPADIRSIEVVSRRLVSNHPASNTQANAVRVTTRNGPAQLPPPRPITFEGVGGPNPLIRVRDDLTFAARDVRLLLDGREIDADRLGAVDPSKIHGVKVVRWGSAKAEVHLTTRQRI